MEIKPNPIICPECNKVLLKPESPEDVCVRCDKCGATWYVRAELIWKYFKEYAKDKQN